MKISFRIECPTCHWGYEWRDAYVNQGYLRGMCKHCGYNFYFKVDVTGVNIESVKELPEDVPSKPDTQCCS